MKAMVGICGLEALRSMRAETGSVFFINVYSVPIQIGDL